MKNLSLCIWLLKIQKSFKLSLKQKDVSFLVNLCGFKQEEKGDVSASGMAGIRNSYLFLSPAHGQLSETLEERRFLPLS